MTAVEKRIGRNFAADKIAEQYSYLDISGPLSKVVEKRDFPMPRYRMLQKINLLNTGWVENVKVHDEELSQKELYRAVKRLKRWIREGELEHFKEAKLSSSLKQYILMFDSVTYHISFREVR